MGLIAIATGLILIYLAVQGPLIRGVITFKTAAIIGNQLVGQDIVNLGLLAPLLIIGAIGLLARKPWAKHTLIATPLFLIYYALSYTIGWEWSSPSYAGNSERFTFFFLFVLIAALIILLYSLAVFPKNAVSRFKKTGLAVYSALFTLFLLVFGGMWIKEILEVMATGTTRAYDIAPTAFWLVRVFDLGFSMPLGLISVYLLWARPDKAYPGHLPLLRLLLHPDRRRQRHGLDDVLQEGPDLPDARSGRLRHPRPDHSLRLLLCPEELQD